jgi:hypothetical protein
MGYVRTVTKLAGTEQSAATRDVESLQRRFEIMQKEKLQSLTEVSENRSKESACQNTHRLFVRIYYVSSQSDQLTY